MPAKQPADRGDIQAQPGGVLGLDPSKTMTGFAYADPAAVAAWPELQIGKNIGPHKGVVYGGRTFIDHAKHADFVWFYSGWLHSLFEDRKPTRVFYEAPLPFPRQRNQKTGITVDANSEARIRVMYSCEAEILRHCRGRNIPVAAIPHGTAKRQFAGGGTTTKEPVLRMCEMRGWEPHDNNAADALAILHTGIILDRSMIRAGNMEARIAKARGGT